MLTNIQKAMLDTAVEVYKHAGSLELVAGERFGLSPTRFWQVVNGLIGTEAALAYRPQAVRLLQARKRPPVRLPRRF